MLQSPQEERRDLKTERITTDLVVVGGGLAGTCCAITAARAGLKVALVQDRPVLGGNASSEVRLWVLGATAHLSNNNRWSREGGVIDELLVENVYRNPEGNPVLFDTVLLEKVVEEPNLTLLLNTACIEVTKSDPDTIGGIGAFCSQNSTLYRITAPLFCDASGDGVVGFLAGAPFRMGAEREAEFGEKFAPTQEYGELLGHSIYFFTKDLGRPVAFTPPSYALKDVPGTIPRYRNFGPRADGCRLWWIEYGGRLDTVHDTEQIKWELWKVVYGVWDYIKNSGNFPDAETLTLEWVGLIPGKRESRRFEGPYLLRQQDIVEQRRHDDAVSFGGWSIDLHPADGVFSDKPGCTQLHSRGIYQIPYGCLYSRGIRNLFLAGRIISTTHVAFGSTRVMATCAHSAQAVGMAAAMCLKGTLLPDELTKPEHMKTLQRDLLRAGQFIPGVPLDDTEDLVRRALTGEAAPRQPGKLPEGRPASPLPGRETRAARAGNVLPHAGSLQSLGISATSRYRMREFPPDGSLFPLARSVAQMVPVNPGKAPHVRFLVDSREIAVLQLELRTSNRPDNYAPDVVLAKKEVTLSVGKDLVVEADFDVDVTEPRYLFYVLRKNDFVSVRCTKQRVTGLLSLVHRHDQRPERDFGVETFEFWCPQRRPGGQNLAATFDPPLDVFGPENVANGFARPTCGPNAWVADPDDRAPALTIIWDEPQTIARIDLAFDTDLDYPMESVVWGHGERVMPFCVKRYRITDAAGNLLVEVTDNHVTRRTHLFEKPVMTDRLTIHYDETWGQGVPAALFEVRCYEGAALP